MKKIICTTAIICIFYLGVAGCALQGEGSGPLAWIDQPLDNSLLPLGPVKITVHASDSSGVSRFEIFAGAEQVESISTGGCTLCSAATSWNPPGDGNYIISVRALDTGGTAGMIASARIRIGGGSPTPTPAQPAQSMVPPAPTGQPATPTPAHLTTATAAMTATAGQSSAPSIEAQVDANCHTGPGLAYTVVGALMTGQTAAIQARSTDSAWVLITPSMGVGPCWVAVSIGHISGNLLLARVITVIPPPTNTPTKTRTVPPPSGPPKVNISLGDSTLLTQGNPCTNHPDHTSVTASVKSGAAIASVTLHWNLNGDQGNRSMSQTSGNNFTAILGPFANPGDGSVWVEATDNNGLTGSSSIASFQVSSACVQ